MKRQLWIVTLFVLAVPAALLAIGLYRDANPATEIRDLTKLLALEPGMTVAEIGAGSGRMTLLAARTVGPSGRVIATELDGPDLADLREAAASAELSNVEAVQGTQDGPNLPDECCDAVFMSKVYHHFARPTAMNEGLFEALKPGGRLAVIDFEPRAWRFWLPRPAGVPENRGGHGMPVAVLLEELADAGFSIEHVDEQWWAWPEQRFCVVARKP